MSWKVTPTQLLVDDQDALAYLTAVEAADGQALESSVRLAVNAFVKGCKADGIWPAIKASCILAGARTLAGALVPLAGTAPTNFNFVSGDYNRKTGLVGNGSSKYLNCNRAANADPLNNCHYAVFPTAAASSAGTPRLLECQSYTTSGASLLAEGAVDGYVATNRKSFNIANNAPRVVSSLVGTSRSIASSYKFRRNGATVDIGQASEALGAPTVTWKAFVNDAGTGEFSNARLAFYSIGGSIDLAKLDTRVTTMINAFGAAIP